MWPCPADDVFLLFLEGYAAAIDQPGSVCLPFDYLYAFLQTYKAMVERCRLKEAERYGKEKNITITTYVLLEFLLRPYKPMVFFPALQKCKQEHRYPIASPGICGMEGRG